MRILFSAVILVLFTGMIGCGSSKSQQPVIAEPQPATNSESQPTQSETKRYHLEGTVVTVDGQQKRLIVDGKDIPGFMAAMTMPYPVADDQTLDRVKPGDQITADVVTTGRDFHLDNVVVVKHVERK